MSVDDDLHADHNTLGAPYHEPLRVDGEEATLRPKPVDVVVLKQAIGGTPALPQYREHQ